MMYFDTLKKEKNENLPIETKFPSVTAWKTDKCGKRSADNSVKYIVIF